PKGVVVSHRSIIDYIEWILNEDKICPKPDDIIGNQSPFYFDNSVLDIYLCFFKGIKLVIIPEEKFLFPKDLLQYLYTKHINYIFWVPSLLNNIAKNKILDSSKPKFQKILFAGENMPTKTLNYWMENYPGTTFANLYGPTEITVDCTFYIIDKTFKENESLPIGTSCRNTQVMIFDESNQLITKSNQIGEICVRGSCLSLGYYNDLEKTNSVFIQNPLHQKYEDRVYKTGDLGYYTADRHIILTGRKDQQIKHNGYRIELGEIELALGDFDAIEGVCVVYDEQNSIIRLFYESKKEISKAEIFNHLKDKLPKYMLPQEYIWLETLPLNPNSKIDRKALKTFKKESK
ncbi:AMP-binding protein, partial [Helicobacter sp. 13S00477-4]|uniref:AMP-binding protein n=1 Tax=Helicobacter sp. 13S00477-4 TaxID=1905759 RepID=UPI000BA69A31